MYSVTIAFEQSMDSIKIDLAKWFLKGPIMNKKKVMLTYWHYSNDFTVTYLPRNRPAIILTNPAATVILAFVDSPVSVLKMLRPNIPIIRPTRKNKIPAQVKIRPASNKSGRPEYHCNNYANKWPLWATYDHLPIKTWSYVSQDSRPVEIWIHFVHRPENRRCDSTTFSL